MPVDPVITAEDGAAPIPVTLNYDQPISSTIERMVDLGRQIAAGQWDLVHELSALNDCIYIKNRERHIIYASPRYANTFSRVNTPLGKRGDEFLDREVSEISEQTDSLVLTWLPWVDCEHRGRLRDGGVYQIRTYKHSFLEYGNANCALIGLSRPTKLLADVPPPRHQDLRGMFARYRELDATDRDISRWVAQGETTREIAGRLKLTPRAVELRRQRILESLQLASTVDLVKLLVRLQDRGFVDFGL